MSATREQIRDFVNGLDADGFVCLHVALEDRFLIPAWWTRDDFCELSDREWESLREYAHAGDDGIRDHVIEEWEQRPEDWVEPWEGDDEEEDEE